MFIYTPFATYQNGKSQENSKNPENAIICIYIYTICDVPKRRRSRKCKESRNAIICIYIHIIAFSRLHATDSLSEIRDVANGVHIYTYYCTFSVFGIFLTFSILVGGKWCIYIHIIAYSWIFMKIIEIPENAIWTYYICSVLHGPAKGGTNFRHIANGVVIAVLYCIFLDFHENAI